jgi:DNA-directed RNA polymerase
VDVRDPKTAKTASEKEEFQVLYDERRSVLRELTIYYNQLAERRKNGRIHQLVWMAANQFVKEERFWIPWSFDFRTRMYPISILNPQSANHINGLMEFADGYPIDDKTEYWLSVHVATTKGFSKETFEGRVEWVRNHHKEITLVATDPLGEGRRYWTEEADEPWTYLAACREFYEIFIAKTRDVTHTPCGLDATASGLQILGGLMGDESTCQLVNVLPTKKPSDLYQAVIDKTSNLQRRARKFYGLPYDQLTRKVAKAPTMTLAYGSTPWRRKHQVKAAINGKRGLGLNLKWDKLSTLLRMLDDAIAFVLPGVTFTLRWLQEVAVASMNQSINPGKTMVLWTTPAGSVVHQTLLQE